MKVSGNDPIGVESKGIDPGSTHVPTRFLISANELPILSDSAGALRRRLIVLHFSNVVVEKDRDLDLKSTLRGELTSILNWAIEGYQRLRRNGKFTEIEVGEDEESLVDQIVDAGSAVSRFAEECCVLGDELEATWADLYFEFKVWCELNHEERRSEAKFRAELCGAFHSLRRKRLTVDGGGRAYGVVGIAVGAPEVGTEEMKATLREDEKKRARTKAAKGGGRRNGY